MAAGCGEKDEQDVTAALQPAGYTSVSDVSAHEAIGRDMATIREALDAGDFESAATVWSDGAHSRKDDGTMRTLAGFVDGHPVAGFVEAALAGRGPARGFDDEQRAEWVDKGMIVAIEAKVLDELDAAIEKAKAGETEPAEGAPHNVDEAWAFFTAEGEGLAATAEKRANDFGLGDKVVEPVLGALRAAQEAARSGDAGALLAARQDARGAMNYVFALAVAKYAKEAIDSPKARAEGIAFSWGLRGDLDTAGMAVVQKAFGSDPGFRRALAVRETLNASLDELGLDQEVPPVQG
jgi:hypothetical protein